MNGLLYYVIDTETTGLKTDYHEMSEIGIIRYTDRVQLWRQLKCDYPERANFDALAITKKTLADLERGLDKFQVVEECEKFFAEDGATPAHRCIVAHNAAFDRKFLHALWAQCGKQFPANLWIDTISMTKDFIKQVDISTLNITKTATGKTSTKLHACCDIVGIKKLSEAHNAKVDSRNTYLLFRNLMDEKKIDHLKFIKTEIHSFNSVDNASDDGLDPSLLDI
jgi:DNA polymerase III epsilon subunit-like protein